MGPESRRWQCSLRNVSWKTTCKKTAGVNMWPHVTSSVCVFGAYWCKHSLPLVVSECDPLCWHFEVDNGGLLRGVHGECYRRGLLNCLMSSQWLQCHRAQIPHVTCCTIAQTYGLQYIFNTPAHSRDSRDNNSLIHCWYSCYKGTLGFSISPKDPCWLQGSEIKSVDNHSTLWSTATCNAMI